MRERIEAALTRVRNRRVEDLDEALHRFYAARALPPQAAAPAPVEPLVPPAEKLHRVGRGRFLLACVIIVAIMLVFYLHPPGTAEFDPAAALQAPADEPVRGLAQFHPYARPFLLAAGLSVSLSCRWLSRWLADRRFNAFADDVRARTTGGGAGG